MAFSDLIETVNITDLGDGDAVLLDRLPGEADTGWDSLRDTWLIRNDSAGTDAFASLNNAFAAANFGSLARGQKVGTIDAWIQSRRPRCRARGLFEVEVNALGLLSPRGLKVRYGSGTNIQSGTNIVVTGEGLKARASMRESQVTAEVEYIVTAGLTPGNAGFYTAQVGAAQNPPTGWVPTIKDSIINWATEYTYWVPNGWILDACDVENLPGLNTVWLIRERYQYQYEASF